METKPLRILMVEDNAADAELLELELQNGGYAPSVVRVQTAAAMEAALDENWDLILSDYAMPQFSGIEALEILQRSRKNIPFILISGSAGEDIAVRAMKAGAHDFFVKGKTTLLLPAIERELKEAELRSTAEAHHERALDLLWHSEERFRLLVNAVKDYAIFMVDRHGRIATWNSGAERVTGFSADDVIGQSVSMLRPHDTEPVEQVLARIRTEESAEWESVSIRKDGTRYLSRKYCATMRDRNGELLGYVNITRDVTEQRDLEAQLVQAQKLDSLGQLAGGIAHDFNNMLMVIFTRCELLLRLVQSDQARKMIGDIHAAAMKNRELTQQLLGAARQQVLEPQVVNLNEVVTSTMRLLGPTLGEHILRRTELDPSLWNVYADPGKLHQVLLNLAINARDAMPRGGTLTIETRNVHVDAAYPRQHLGLREGDYVTLIVSDNGSGIPAHIRDRIYDPFFTTKEAGRGTGLGLAVVRGVIVQTGGLIWMYSEEGLGTTFKIFLPRHWAEVTENAADDVALLQRGSETILLVEDEELLRSVVSETLQEQGYRVIEAKTAAEALTLCDNFSAPIHLLLSDVVMPGMSGNELAEVMLARRPDVGVILMSGYTSHTVMSQASVPPSVRYLEKPVQTRALLRMVRLTLDKEV